MAEVRYAAKELAEASELRRFGITHAVERTDDDDPLYFACSPATAHLLARVLDRPVFGEVLEAMGMLGTPDAASVDYHVQRVIRLVPVQAADLRARMLQVAAAAIMAVQECDYRRARLETTGIDLRTPSVELAGMGVEDWAWLRAINAE